MQLAVQAEFNLALRQLALQIEPDSAGVVQKKITDSIVWFCQQNLQTVDQKVVEQAIQQLTRKSVESHLRMKQASSRHLASPTQEEIQEVHKRITPFAIQVIKGVLNTNLPEIKLAKLVLNPKVDVTAIEPFFGLENLKWNDPIKVSDSSIPLGLLDLTIKFQRTDMTKLMIERLGDRLVPSVTSLWLAIAEGNVELVKLLVSHPKIDVNSLYFGRPPLYYACLRKNSHIVDLLIDSTNDSHKNLVLEEAAKGGNYWAVKKLLQSNYLFEIPEVYSEASYQSTLFSLSNEVCEAEVPDLKKDNLLENNLTYIHHLLRNYKNNPTLIRFHLNRYSYDTFYFTMCSLITNLVSNSGNWSIDRSDWWKDLSITKKEAFIEETRRFMCSLEPRESKETWNQKFLEYIKLYLNDAQWVKIHDGDKKELEGCMHDCWKGFSATLFLWYSEHFLVFKHIKEGSLEDVQQYAKRKNIPSYLVSIQLYNEQDKFLSRSSFKLMSPLALACKEGKDLILQTLVTAGFKPYAGMWDLMKCGNVDQEEVLFDCWNDQIVTAVIEACEQGNINQMQILMTAKGGVDLNYFEGSNFGWTLRRAIQHPKLVAFLLKSGALPEDADENGSDAIDVALDIEDEDLQEEIVKLILPYFNFASKDRSDRGRVTQTTLEKIKKNGNDELVEALITTKQFLDLDLKNAILESLRLGKREITRKILLKSTFAFTKKFTPEFIAQLKQEISSHLANLNSDSDSDTNSDSDSDSEIQNQNDQPEIADLVLRYLDNPREVKAELHAAEVFALTVFLCDDLLRLRQPKPNQPFTQAELNTQRCFKILKALPMELQMIMSRRFFGLSGDGIPAKARNAAFAGLAESF